MNSVAGRTTDKNNAVKAAPPGNPTIINADVKKIVPETIVPITTNTVATTIFCAYFFT